MRPVRRHGAEHLLGRERHGVGVPRCSVVETSLRRGGQFAGGSRRDGSAVAGEDPLERLGGGELLGDAGQLELTLVAQVVGDDVDVVLGAAAGQHRVEQLPGLLAGDDAVHDVGGQALGGVDGGGVAELDMGGDVLRGQHRGESGVAVSHGQGAVAGCR